MISIAIDGPSGVGKSTVAKILAGKFNFIYLDTGALYRTFGYYFIQNNLDYNNPQVVKANLKNIKISFESTSKKQRMFLCGQNVTQFIRTEEVSSVASKISAMPQVREFLLDMQRNMARENDIVMDGRDIGTVVLPNADIKFFLTASVKVRARRRWQQLKRKKPKTDFYSVLKALEQRDRNDTQRASCPLKPAKNAIILDTSRYGLGKTIAVTGNIIREYINDKKKFAI